MKRYLLLLVLSAGMCAGQHKGCLPNKTSDPTACMVSPEEPCASREWDHNGKCVAEPAPLKCGKYEHEEKTPAHCANTCPPDGAFCTTQCSYVAATDVCAPDLHTVTEKEWQELMSRLKRLEERNK